VFRVRLGKALDFQYHEDYIGSLFSIKGPRDSTALLDIERAFDKLERVALQRRKKYGKPIVLIVSSMHLLRDDDDGRDLIELMQQRAEQWAAAGLVTMVFNSDDYWVFERMRQYATRMSIVTISDLPKSAAIQALRKHRMLHYSEDPPESLLDKVYDRVGGRLTFINQVARAPDMLAQCRTIHDSEKRWFLNQCWILGPDMDDDVMDQQKYAAAAVVLAKALVKKDREINGDNTSATRPLPEIPLHIARQIMTRADFMQKYEHLNFFKIDAERGTVRADNIPMMNAFIEICSEEGFEEHLQGTIDRIADIESLGRTRELVAKDLVLGESYQINAKGKGDEKTMSIGFGDKRNR